jgi:hypothetical protein
VLRTPRALVYIYIERESLDTHTHTHTFVTIYIYIYIYILERERENRYTHTHTHTHIHIHIYMYTYIYDTRCARSADMKQELLASGMREPGRRAYGGAVVWLFLLDGTCDGCPSLVSASLPSKVVVKVSVKRSYSSCMRLLAASLTA